MDSKLFLFFTAVLVGIVFSCSAFGEGKQPATDRDLRELSKWCDGCSTAKDAVQLIKTFELTHSVAAQKEKLSELREKWEQRAKDDLVRLGRDWVTRERLAAADAEEESLRNQAFALVAINDFDGARQMLEEAADANPNRFIADYCLGLYYTLHNDPESARQSFQRVLKIAPNHVGALNNLGVADVKDHNVRRALANWEKAAAAAPGNVSVMHNAGRVISEHNNRRIKVSSRDLTRLRKLYGALATNSKFRTTGQTCWLLVPPLAPVDQHAEPAKNAVRTVNLGNTGTGFSVHKDFCTHQSSRGASRDLRKSRKY